MSLKEYIEKYQKLINDSIEKNLPVADSRTNLNEAIKYAVFSGGKRIRPVLTLLGAEIFGGDPAQFSDAAAASEYIHASSLIFDDLPCMDNASVRRGKISLHEKYDEGIAILAAVSLLNSSYGLIFNCCKIFPERIAEAHAEIVECVGTQGMTGGQAMDLALAKNVLSEETGSNEIEKLKNLKTSALIRLSLCVGAILAGADEKRLNALREFSINLGEAYQLSDDLIDLTEDEKIFSEGESPVSAAEISGAENRLQTIIANAKNILTENFPPSDARNCLIELSDYIASRKE